MTTPIAAGELRSRITFQTIAQTKDSVGGMVNTPTSAGSYWAKVEPASGTEKMIGAQNRAIIDYKITTRYLGSVLTVTSGMRIVYQNEIYNIIGPPIDVNNEHHTTVMYVKKDA